MLPNKHQSDLISKAQAVIKDVCKKRLGSMSHHPAIETDFAGSFVKNGIPALDAAFNQALIQDNIKTKITSVYIHQSPLVRILDASPRPISTNQCELGDVLLVQSHRRNRWKTYWRAALWQLKADHGGQQTATDPQFWLYANWPLFDAYRGGLERGSRDFTGDTRSGYYGLVNPSHWLICPPSQKIGSTTAGNVDAGQFLVEMMYAVDPAQPGRNSNRGRRVFTRPNAVPPLNWSKTIWELLNITGSKSFNSRKLYNSPQTRISLMYNSDEMQTPDISALLEYRSEGLHVLHISVDASDFNPTVEEGRPS